MSSKDFDVDEPKAPKQQQRSGFELSIPGISHANQRGVISQTRVKTCMGKKPITMQLLKLNALESHLAELLQPGAGPHGVPGHHSA